MQDKISDKCHLWLVTWCYLNLVAPKYQPNAAQIMCTGE